MNTPSRAHRRMIGVRILSAALLLGAVVLALGCASRPPPPKALMAVSAAALNDAASAGGDECAPEEMRRTRDKMSRAITAMKNENHARATLLASEAQADAELAQAKCRAAHAAQAAAAVKEDGQVLREEMQRQRR